VLQQERGEPLLRAVVQVTLDAAPGLIAATIVPAILLPGRTVPTGLPPHTSRRWEPRRLG
jgi:hypothetical protein